MAKKSTTEITIYHNTRCAKSRTTLIALQQKYTTINIVEYLKQPFTKTQFKKVLAQLNLSAHEVVRKNEAYYKERLKGLKLSNDEWITILLEQPTLIQRPIVVKGNVAKIVRDDEDLEKFI